ncbi:uncharacterized protein LOC132755987 [Ruditapes philippinarum]|uniref:uncharacterized protein LOC132755987 n=1 Tax=Ruditapes philippinarum TaxID=129788 RepID=UPI00295B0845|nr:uncharacterized protein LOC132755987 [Ruditapes philippinarum]
MLDKVDERSTRPKVKFDLANEEERKADLREVLKEMIAKYAMRARSRSHTVRSEESGQRCDEEYNITVPCIDMTDDGEFMQCALDEGEKTETTFARIYKENNDDTQDLYSKRELRIASGLRKTDLVSLKVKEYTDMMVEEMGYLRFRVGADFDNMSDETVDELLECHCSYTVIKEETYRRIINIPAK